MKERDFDFSTRKQSNEKIQYLHCTVACTVSRDDITIKIMVIHQNAA